MALAPWLAVSLLATMFLGAADAGAARAPRELRALPRQVAALPSTAATKPQRRKLRRSARHAKRVAGRRPCTAVRDLARFRKVLKRVKVKRGRRFRRGNRRVAALGPASLVATQKLLARKRTRRCGGGVKPSTRRATKTTVLKSDADGIKLRVQLPELHFVPRTGGGRNWTQLTLPNTDSPAAPGEPGIPVASSIFGVPDGAALEVKAKTSASYTVPGVSVFPAQPDPVDDEPRPNFLAGRFADPPFTLDKDAYADRGLTPARPADGAILGRSRDLVIGNLQIPAAQYNPVAQSVKVLKSVEVTLAFKGGAPAFNDEIASPWELPQQRVAAALLNAAVIRRGVFELIPRCGEEMLVITNPATRPAADAFAAAKRAAGMRTSVVDVGAATGQAGTTAAEIQSFIRARLTRLGCIRPSYVTIMGDDDLVPTFPGINGIPSDLPYSLRDGADELPDVAVGRIIGHDQAAVGAAVGKIVNYAANPPTGPMLGRATLAAQFQDDNLDGIENRTFIQFAETVRRGLVSRGVAVDRIYDDHPTATPLKFNDGTDLPDALKKPTFAWDGDAADVTAAWNDGRFMVIHRDHGWSDGWGHPAFGTSNVQALTNGSLLPVVMSINCSSAAYDYDETSFAGEALVKSDGGAVGVFGDTRDSPTWHNTQIALGFVDGLLPSVLPAEGPETKQRTGTALINGKLRLAGLSPPATDGSTRNELYLWHYFGDPSMQMWGGGSAPLRLNAGMFAAVYDPQVSGADANPPPYEVNVTAPAGLNGQAVSLLRNGDVIGKATLAGGGATIPAAFGDGSVGPGDLEIALEPDGSPAVRAPVLFPSNAPTALTQTCPPTRTVSSGGRLAVSGVLSGAPAGSEVEVEFRAPGEGAAGAGRTVVTRATTDSGGGWSTFVDSTASEYGDWQISSRYAGGGQYAAAAAGPCTVAVKRDTDLAQSCPAGPIPSGSQLTVTGTLSNAPAGSRVEVEFRVPDRGVEDSRTDVVATTTNASGDWSVTVDTDPFEYGNWRVRSRYAGTDDYGPSESSTCTVVVTNNT